MPRLTRILVLITTLAAITHPVVAEPAKRKIPQQKLIFQTPPDAPAAKQPAPPADPNTATIFIRDIPTPSCPPLPEPAEAPGLVNASSYIIYVKPETGIGIISLSPGEVYWDAVDGFVTPKGRVIKLVDFYNKQIEVDNHGFRFPGSPSINRILGGGVLKKSPDNSWQKLFERQQ